MADDLFLASDLDAFGDVSLFGSETVPVLLPADFTLGVDPRFSGLPEGFFQPAPARLPTGLPRFSLADTRLTIPDEFRVPGGGAAIPPELRTLLAANVERALGDFRIDPQTRSLFDLAGNPVSAEAVADAIFQGVSPGPAAPPGAPATTPAGKGFFESAPGRIATLLALGGAGVGLARLLAGGPRTFTLPTQPPSEAVQTGQAAVGRALAEPAFARAVARPVSARRIPVDGGELLLPPIEPESLLTGQRGATGAEDLEALVRASLAGQRSLAELGAAQSARELLTTAEQAPTERLLRHISLAEVPRFLTAEPDLTTMADFTRSLLEARLTRALRGDLPNPALERRITDARAVLNEQLSRQLGPAYALSTPGIQALAEFDRQAEELRENEIRATIASLAPLEESRRRLALQAPLERERTRAAIRGRGFEERLGLAGLGRVAPAVPSTTLGSLVPIAPLLGIESEGRRAQREALQTQAALGAFQSREAERAQLANQIAQIFGLAGAFGLPRL